MDKTLHSVADLPAAARAAVEALIGQPLRDNQHVYILALDRIEPAAEDRGQTSDELTDILNEAHENVRKSGVPTEEIERLIDAACDDVRYGKQT
jgi:mevalonate kinase